MFHVMEQPLAVVRRHGRSFTILEANPSFIRLTGYEQDKLIHTPFRQLFPKLSDRRKSTILTEGITETTLETGSGSQKTVELDVKAINIHDENGQATYLINAKDMSAEKWLEQQSRSGKALYVGICDQQYRIRMFNTLVPHTMTSGIPAINQSIFNYIDPYEHAELQAQLLHCSQNHYPRDITLRTIKFDEKSEMELRATWCVFFDGFGSISQYAFSVWDVREPGESEQSSMRLKIWMAKRDISASQLSIATGISMQTISKLRNGKIKKPQRLTAELIASELNVDVHTLWPELGKR
ncbi:helix-turn-helix domain-containing protein [Paenibacillus xylaniclasticus]|uniref:helix-turn-helix domain-containing protein n=1 Tax=Paenibacillus xylaniclasticus TaxID=588083 RepID=UPI0021CC7894|nr:helix-turn-helix domain-containing protein [Paenibacillus xylaniclasticus]